MDGNVPYTWRRKRLNGWCHTPEIQLCSGGLSATSDGPDNLLVSTRFSRNINLFRLFRRRIGRCAGRFPNLVLPTVSQFSAFRVCGCFGAVRMQVAGTYWTGRGMCALLCLETRPNLEDITSNQCNGSLPHQIEELVAIPLQWVKSANSNIGEEISPTMQSIIVVGCPSAYFLQCVIRSPLRKSHKGLV